MVQLGFIMKGADDEAIDRFSATAKELIGGWDRDYVRTIIADELERHVRPTVFEEALERIHMHRKRNEKVYVVSATMRDIVEPLAELLGLDGALGTEMEIENGRYTGLVEDPCHGTGKERRLRQFAEIQGIDLAKSAAYSDSISDEGFLRAVGRPYAVNPDKELRRLAESEGWGILSFRTQVEVPLHQRRNVRIGAIAAVATVVGMGVLSRRRAD
jgi:HAD superfamily hydrolase (TIGR01490 family)